MNTKQNVAIDTLILGAGVTGLAAGVATGGRVLESRLMPGGICASYYLPGGKTGRYRFEYGGGHWIFGGDPKVLEWMTGFGSNRSYLRKSAVFLPDRDLYVPYPLQNHLHALGQSTADQVLKELKAGNHKQLPHTMSDWLLGAFGETLCDLFFFPFHEAYTAGLYTTIAPQDPYKSPVDFATVEKGARGPVDAVGYNVTFAYPEQGLDRLARGMAERCDLHIGQRVKAIYPDEKLVFLADGEAYKYQRLISTLPLHVTLQLAGLSVEAPADPHTAVLVLNIGAIAGPRCPDQHWLYLPGSRAGFHRVGFYSNVDGSFCPSPDSRGSRTSIYVEKAYLPGARPEGDALVSYQNAVIDELREWGFIEDIEVVDPTWVDPAYTWAWPDSEWREQAISLLEAQGIEPVGRYARWHFQGIADSIRDGLAVESLLS